MLLLGEATIHQPHGGAATDRPADDHVHRFMRWREHYIALRGHDLPVQSPPLTYFGSLPTAWRVQFAAWILRETLAELPELAPVLARMDAALAADATPQGSAWTECRRSKRRCGSCTARRGRRPAKRTPGGGPTTPSAPAGRGA